ncbi:hypothetical protein GCM10017600_01590 [Streptosporangium carneum]|uniref:Tryptophan synthase beta chain-like PALP domain-containing protein n=1 Tax=Streptosporangium carneum TaxID=47481 RepID=A0A9W6HWN3_9ACTN|nr:hypothetical protein GCM10017600_01590 [Streptosporangium carneum]
MVAEDLRHLGIVEPHGVDRVDRRRQQYRTDVGRSHAARPHGFADRTIAELGQAEWALSIMTQAELGEDLDLLGVTVLDFGERDGVAVRYPIPAVLDDLLKVADDAVLVRETSIVAGMRTLLEHAGLVVEPPAPLGVAAVLEDPDRFVGRRMVTIICGGNVDLDDCRRWVLPQGPWGGRGEPLSGGFLSPWPPPVT